MATLVRGSQRAVECVGGLPYVAVGVLDAPNATLGASQPPRHYFTTTEYSPRGTSSPITVAPATSPASSSPPEVWASASSSASASLTADRAVCGCTQSRVRGAAP